jgi:META domain
MIRLRRTCGPRRVAVFATMEFGRAAGPEFPFDQILLLDAAPMRPAKRKPSLTVALNGSAIVDLWCKTVDARVEVSDTAITIAPAALPEALPDGMANGQCTPERMRVDDASLAALSQVDGWRRQGGALVLTGPATMRFYLSTN